MAFFYLLARFVFFCSLPLLSLSDAVSNTGSVSVAFDSFTTPAGNIVSLSFTTTSNFGYIAISPGGSHGSSAGVVCYMENTTPICRDFTFGGKSTSGVVFAGTNGVINTTGSIPGTITFFRSDTFPNNPNNAFSSSGSSITTAWATGALSPATNGLTNHGTSNRGFFQLAVPTKVVSTISPTAAPSGGNSPLGAGAVVSVIGPITVSVVVTNSQMSLTMATTGTNLGYMCISFNGEHGSSSPGIACWMTSTGPTCADVIINGQSVAGVQVTTAISGVTAVTTGGQWSFSFTRSLTFNTVTLDPAKTVNSWWAIGSTSPTNNQLSYHDIGRDGPSPLSLSSNAIITTIPPTPATTNAVASNTQSSTIAGVPRETFIAVALVIVGSIAILLGVTLFAYLNRQNHTPIAFSPVNNQPVNPIFQQTSAFSSPMPSPR